MRTWDPKLIYLSPPTFASSCDPVLTPFNIIIGSYIYQQACGFMFRQSDLIMRSGQLFEDSIDNKCWNLLSAMPQWVTLFCWCGACTSLDASHDFPRKNLLFQWCLSPSCLSRMKSSSLGRPFLSRQCSKLPARHIGDLIRVRKAPKGVQI